MTTITIVGAGMAGLLAANMLHRHDVRVYEAQDTLPNNHSAVLRFGSDLVGDVLGVPFKKVEMIKGTVPYINPVADALAYAEKCNGIYRSDRSIPVGVERGTRWIAPTDLIKRMAKDIRIDFGFVMTADHFKVRLQGDNEPYISTMPMPALMELLEYPDRPEFSYVEGANIRATVIRADAYATVYIPDPQHNYNRVSVTGNELIIEFAFPNKQHKYDLLGPLMDQPGSLVRLADDAAKHLGLSIYDPKLTTQKYAKIQPIDNDARKKFLAWATDNHNIFSLGRFATWRPRLLMDDLVHDVRLIEKWINNRYDMKASHR